VEDIIRREFNYEDVYLVPQRCIVESRSACKISVKIGPREFRNPVIPANMQSVVDYNTCRYLADLGMFYIMHRFSLDQREYFEFLEFMGSSLFASISVGVKSHDKNLLLEMRRCGLKISYITIDVANAYSEFARNMAEESKSIFPDATIIVGNICTPEAVEYLQESSCIDVLKVGISCGSVCSTKNVTGFNRRMVTTLQDCGKVSNLPMIADGSIKEIGHIAIALNTSENTKYVMLGNMFSGFEQSAGDIRIVDGKAYKEYYGNASEKTKKNNHHVEGVCHMISYKGDMKFFIDQIEEGLKSSVSYSGVDDINDIFGIPMICCN